MIIYGKQMVIYLLEKYPEKIEEVFLSKEIDKKLFSKIILNNIQIKKIDFKKAQALTRGGNHQGFIAKVKDLKFTPLKYVKNEKFILILAGLTDVGNIGAIIRSAYVLGVDAIVISMISNINIEGIVRTSAGAIFDMPIVFYKDINSVINELKQVGFFIYCADMNGDDVRKIKFEDKKALILGSEGMGLSQKILKNCNKKVTIKMSREFDSLNVSAACAILCDRMRDGE